MMLLRLLSWPYLRRHLLRWTLTLAGIVLGVAVFVAMHTANRSIFGAFDKTVDQIAGATQLQISAGEFGFDESVLDRVQSVPEVGVAVPVIEATVETKIAGQGSILVLGIDMTGDRNLRDYDLQDADESIIDDPLVFLAQPDSLMITKEFSKRNGLEVNSKIPLLTIDGEKQFTVRGIMAGGNVAISSRWFTLKSEAAYFGSSDARADEYALYVIQLERQSGEWFFIGGYAGEAVTQRGSSTADFAPDRGLTKTILGRANYTIDTNRSMKPTRSSNCSIVTMSLKPSASSGG